MGMKFWVDGSGQKQKKEGCISECPSRKLEKYGRNFVAWNTPRRVSDEDSINGEETVVRERVSAHL
jgi:hypothetical protein